MHFEFHPLARYVFKQFKGCSEVIAGESIARSPNITNMVIASRGGSVPRELTVRRALAQPPALLDPGTRTVRILAARIGQQ